MNFNEIADALKDPGNENALKLIKQKLCSTEEGRAEYEEAIREKDYYDLQDKIRYIKELDSKMNEVICILDLHEYMVKFFKEMMVQDKGTNPKYFPHMAYPLSFSSSEKEMTYILVHTVLMYSCDYKHLSSYNFSYYGIPTYHKISKAVGSIPQNSIIFMDMECKDVEGFKKLYSSVEDTYYKRFSTNNKMLPSYSVQKEEI